MNINMQESKSTGLWLEIMQIGAKTGCHQRSDRSLFYKGYQFPICARCTGVLIGYIASIITIIFILPDFWLGFAFCAIMFIDWLIQFINIQESNNIRRLITGLMGGYGIITCEFNIALYIILKFWEMFL